MEAKEAEKRKQAALEAAAEKAGLFCIKSKT